MGSLAEELRALTVNQAGKSKGKARTRSRANFEAIRQAVTGLKEHADEATVVLEALAGFREQGQEFLEALDAASPGNPLVAFAGDLADALPGDDGDLDIGELAEEAWNAAEAYESVQDDPDCDADTRDAVWGELLDAVECVASALGGPR